MITDVHSHAWSYPEHFTDDFRQQARRARAGTEVDLTVRFEDYQKCALEPVRTIVFGGKARLSGLWVDDRYVANYVAAHPDQLIGFLSLDPTQPGWDDELRYGHQELKLRGIKLMPTYHPAYVLRQYTVETRRAVWDDLQMVMKELNLPLPKPRQAEG